MFPLFLETACYLFWIQWSLVKIFLYLPFDLFRLRIYLSKDIITLKHCCTCMHEYVWAVCLFYFWWWPELTSLVFLKLCYYLRVEWKKDNTLHYHLPLLLQTPSHQSKTNFSLVFMVKSDIPWKLTYFTFRYFWKVLCDYDELKMTGWMHGSWKSRESSRYPWRALGIEFVST